MNGQLTGATNQALYAQLQDKPEPIVTLGSIAERHDETGKYLSEAERKLADMLEHICGQPASYGDLAGGNPQKQPTGLAGRMHDQARDANAKAARINALIHNLMTRLGINEPTSIGRTA